MNLVAHKLHDNIKDSTGRKVKGYVDKMNVDRTAVAWGPVQVANATDAQKEKAMEMLTVPLRFVSRKSRTALVVPSNFDPIASIARSNQLPNYELVRYVILSLPSFLPSFVLMDRKLTRCDFCEMQLLQ